MSITATQASRELRILNTLLTTTAACYVDRVLDRAGVNVGAGDRGTVDMPINGMIDQYEVDMYGSSTITQLRQCCTMPLEEYMMYLPSHLIRCWKTAAQWMWEPSEILEYVKFLSELSSSLDLRGFRSPT